MTERSFVGFLCWREDSTRMLHADVVETPTEFFLASHRPVRAWRYPFGAPQEREVTDENDLLKAFLVSSDENVIVPVIGESGTGKSHLVRWLHRRLLPSRPDQLVIYVPRDGTNLYGVLERILESLPEPSSRRVREAQETLRARLRASGAQVTAAELRTRLLAEIANTIEFVLPDDGRTRTDDARGSHYAFARKNLPYLLGDPVLRTAFTRDATVIAALARRIQAGVGDADAPDGIAFTPADLAPDDSDSGQASKYARNLYDRIRRNSDPSLNASLCEVVNSAVEPAVERLVGLDGSGGPDLVAIMNASRRVLAEEGRELLLLIEDLSLLHGIQRQLLDVLISPLASPDGQLCRIRAAIAVTTGFWEDQTRQETLQSRLRSWAAPVFDLDVTSDAKKTHDQALGMLAAQLNAVRLGQERLAEELEADPGQSQPTVSACADCEHRVTCHGAFGQFEGRGLYPFNGTASERLIVAAKGTDSVLRPRSIVSAVRDTLRAGSRTLPAGHFPPPTLGRHFAREPLSPADENALQGHGPEVAARYQTFCEVWGRGDLSTIDARVHDAFDLPGLTGSPAPDSTVITSVLPPTPGSVARVTGQQPVDPVLQEIGDWGRDPDRAIGQSTARVLRQTVYNGVLARIPWSIFSGAYSADARALILEELSLANAGRSVAIEGARGEDHKSDETRTLADYRRDTTSAEILSALTSTARTKNWLGDQSGRSLPLVLNRLDDDAARVQAEIEELTRELMPSDYVARLLLLTGLAIGLAGSTGQARGTRDGRLSVVLSQGATPATGEERCALWTNLVERCSQARTDGPGTVRDRVRSLLIATCSRSQGQAAVAFDAAQVLLALDAAPEASLGAAASAPSWLRRWERGVMELVEPALREEWKRIREWRSLALREFGEAPDFEALEAEARTIYQDLTAIGFNPESGPRFLAALTELASIGPGSYEETLSLSESSVPPKALTEALEILGDPLASHVRAVTQRCANLGKAYLDGVESNIARFTPGSGEPTVDLVTPLDRLHDALGALRRATGFGPA